MTYIKSTLCLIFIISFSLVTNAQITLKGLVKAADTNEPIPFAIVKNLKTNKLISGNESGIFSIQVESLPVTLQVNSIGFAMTTIEIVKADSLPIILLQPSTLNLNEVNVYASKGGMQASNLQSLKSIESYKLAGTTKDIFRSIQMLPGVSSNNAASASYNVRGGTFDENLMLINGIEVAEPYHIKVFPMASIGIFNIDMVQRIDFSTGGFGAEYGDALSSVLNVDYKKANNDSITGMVNLGMIDLGAITELPLGKKTSLLIGARQSYLDPVIGMMDIDEKISIKYFDVQAKLDHQFSQRHSISLFAIYSQDKDKVGPQTYSGVEDTRWNLNNSATRVPRTWNEYFMLDSKYDDLLMAITTKHSISSRLQFNTELSYYSENEDRPQYNNDSISYTFPVPNLFNRSEFNSTDLRKYRIEVVEAKVGWKILINPSNSIKSGIYLKSSSYQYNRQLSTSWHYVNNTENYPTAVDYLVVPSDPSQNSLERFDANALKYGAYTTYSLQINSKLIFNSGVRLDYFQLNKSTDISPRLSVAYSIDKSLKVNAAWGIYYKSPIMKQMKYSYNSSDNTKSQSATQYLLGLEKKQDGITLKVETYYKKYGNLIPLRRTSNGEIIYNQKENLNEGFARGVDLEFVYSKNTYDFWLNYSIGEAKERAKGTSSYYSRYTDQTHTLSSLLSLKLPRKNEFDIKITYGSGYAYQLRILDSNRKNWILGEKIATAHLPYYLSLDLRYKKDFRLKYGQLQLYVDIMNVLNRKNVLGHQYSFNSMEEPQEEDFKFLGILPTFGIIYNF
jgi:outer membrane cobalamin receptor